MGRYVMQDTLSISYSLLLELVVLSQVTISKCTGGEVDYQQQFFNVYSGYTANTNVDASPY